MPQSTGNLGGRVKITIACEGCRRRRARCEGTQPCDYCKSHRLDCVYDRQRQRRGPRARVRPDSNSSNLQQVPSSLSASATTANKREINKTNSNNGEARLSPLPEPDIPGLPLPQTWCEDVESCLKDAQSILPADQHAINTGLICHLIELFFSHVNVQQAPLILAEDFFTNLKSGTCSAALCFAMCSTSMHYLVHRSTISLRDTVSEHLFALKARRCLANDRNRHLVHRVQSHCVLALHEMHQANGLQAWVELASAKAILHIIQATAQDALGNARALELASNFVRVLDLTLLVGNATLSPGAGYHMALANMARNMETHLMVLLDLQVRIQQFTAHPDQGSGQPHWHSASMFRRLQSELDRFLLELPDEICSTRLILDYEIDNGSVTRLHCSLTWHCCVLILNRMFLPTRSTPSGEDHLRSIDQVSPSDQSSPNKRPVHFQAERRNACFASASCIATICNEFMMQGTFLPTPLMGYSCYQSCLILLEQLHESQEADRKDVMRHLQICFALLGAMRRFYLPVENWIDTILDVACEPRGGPVKEVPGDVSDHYFARFPNVKEAAMIPLMTEPRTARRLTAVPPQSSVASGTTTSPPPTTLVEVKKNAWLDVYQDNLQDHIEAYSTSPKDQGAIGSLDGHVAEVSPGGITAACGSEVEAYTAPTVTMSAVQQGNGLALLGGHGGAMGSDSELREPTTDPSAVVHGRPLQSADNFHIQHDADLDCLAPQYASMGTEVMLEPGQSAELSFDELPWPVPSQYDFCGDLDIEAMLSQQLYHGEAWTDAHVGAQISAYQNQWSDGIFGNPDGGVM
ncbi:hypothetical protein LTR72_010983 [Exophiala xenobiotica]|nr:hypothetical protein LTR72_010983 [Exophiala xenobiotica]